MIVTVGSIRGSPGVTSWAVLLASAWPNSEQFERVVLEADPAGGVLGARYGIGVEPGVVSFVTSLRRETSSEVVEVAGGRRVEERVWIIPGPESAEQARAVWLGTAAEVAEVLADDAAVWLVDAGRLDEANPAIEFVARADMTVLVVGARSEDLVQVRARVAALQHRGSRVAVLVVGACGYSRAELAEFASTDLVWVMRPQGDLIDAVRAVLSGRRGRRCWAWRQAVEVAADISAALPSADTANPVGLPPEPKQTTEVAQ